MTSGSRHAAAKLAGLALLGVVVFRIDGVVAPGLLLAGVVAIAALGGARPRALLRQVRAVLPLVAAVLVAHALLSGWEHATVVALRILVLVAAAGALTLTTPTSALLSVVSSAARPLRRFGLDPARVGLVLAMTIRFVPLLGDRLAALRQAQRARGVERPGPSLLVPLLVTTLRLADDLADALDARGLGDGPPDSERSPPRLP